MAICAYRLKGRNCFYDYLKNVGDTMDDMYRIKYELLNRWLYIQLKGYSLCSVLKKIGKNSVVICGINKISDRLIEECEKDKFSICCVCDARITECMTYGDNIRVVPLCEIADEVDINTIVVVTEIEKEDELKNKLGDIGFDSVLTFRELIDMALRDSNKTRDNE